MKQKTITITLIFFSDVVTGLVKTTSGPPDAHVKGFTNVKPNCLQVLYCHLSSTRYYLYSGHSVCMTAMSKPVTILSFIVVVHVFPRGVLPSPKLVVSFSLVLVVTSSVTFSSLENCVSTIVQVFMHMQISRNND